MSSSQMQNLAEGSTTASLQDRSLDAVINGSEDTATIHNTPSQATLLGIPQELRNKIFEYVYGAPDAANGWIQIRVLGPSWATGVTAGPNLAINASVRVPPCLAPPSKNAILACRQLYVEMGNMQAAAFRQYWSESRFDIRDDHGLLSNTFYAGSDRDLQHIKRFVDHVNCNHEMIPVRLRFHAGKWIAAFQIPEKPWSEIFRYLYKPLPRGFQRLAAFEQKLRAHPMSGAFSGGRAIMDPECGLGFTATDLHAAKDVIRTLIHEWFGSFF